MDDPKVTDVEEGVKKKRRSSISVLIRLIVGVGIIALIIWRTNLSQFVTALSKVNPWWLLVGFLVQQSSVYVWALRWSRLLVIVGMPVPLTRLIKGLFVGGFVSSFLPTSFSGDFFRGYWVLDDRSLYRKSLFIVFVERFIGLVTLGYLMLPIFAVYILKGSRLNDAIFPLFLITALLCFSIVLLHPKVFAFFDRVVFGDRALLADVRSKVSSALVMVHQAGRALVMVYVYSFIIQADGILLFYCLGRALGLPIELWQYALIVPPTALATMFIPISFNGLGVREVMLVLLTSALSVAVAPAQAVALGVLVFLLNSVGALMGGAVYVVGKPAREFGVP